MVMLQWTVDMPSIKCQNLILGWPPWHAFCILSNAINFFFHDDWSSTEGIHIFLGCNFHTDSVVPLCNNNNKIICIRNRYLRIVVPVRQDHQHSGQSYFPGRGHLRPLYAHSRFNNNQNKCFVVVYFSLWSWWQKCFPSGWMAWMGLVGWPMGWLEWSRG